MKTKTYELSSKRVQLIYRKEENMFRKHPMITTWSIVSVVGILVILHIVGVL